MISNLRSAILMNSKVCDQHNTASVRGKESATDVISSVTIDSEDKATYRGEKKRITFVDFPVAENPHVNARCSTQTSPQESGECVSSTNKSNVCSASTIATSISSSRSVSSTANGTTPTPPHAHNKLPQTNSLLLRQAEQSDGNSVQVKIETVGPIDDTCLSVTMSTPLESRGTHEGHDTSFVHGDQHSKFFGGTSPTLLASCARDDDDSTKIADKHCVESNPQIFEHGCTIMMSSASSSSSSSSPSPQPPHGAVPKEKERLVAPKRLRSNSELVIKEDLPQHDVCGSERNEGNVNNPHHRDSCQEALRRLCDEHPHAAKSITPSSRKRFSTAENASEQILPVSMLSSVNQTSSREGDCPDMSRNEFFAAARMTPTPPSKTHKTSSNLKKSSCTVDKSSYVMIPNLFLGAVNSQQSSQQHPQSPITTVKKEQSDGDGNEGCNPPVRDAQATSKVGKGKGYFVPYKQSDYSDVTAGPFNEEESANHCAEIKTNSQDDATQSNPQPDEGHTSAVQVAAMSSMLQNDHDNSSHRERDGSQADDGSSDNEVSKDDHGQVANEGSNVSLAQSNCTPSQRYITAKNGEILCPPVVPYRIHQPPSIDTQSMWATPNGERMLRTQGEFATFGESRSTASLCNTCGASPHIAQEPSTLSVQFPHCQGLPYSDHLPSPQHYHGPFAGGYPPSAYHPYSLFPFSQHPSYIPSAVSYYGHRMAPPLPGPRYPIRNENSPILREAAANTCSIPVQTVSTTLILNDEVTARESTFLPQPIKQKAAFDLSMKKEERQSSESGEAAYEHMPNNGDRACSGEWKNSAYLPPNSSAYLPRAHCGSRPNILPTAIPTCPTPPPTPIVSAYKYQSHAHCATSATQAPAAPLTSNSFDAAHTIGKQSCPRKNGEGGLVASLRALSDASKILLEVMMNSRTKANKIKSETGVISLDDDDDGSSNPPEAFNAETGEQVAISTLFSAMRRFKKASAGTLCVPCENDDCPEEDEKMNGEVSGKRRRCENRNLLTSSPVSREVQTDIMAIPAPIPPTARRNKKSASQQTPRGPRVLATSGDRSQTPPLSPSSASRGNQHSITNHKLGHRFEGDDEDSPVVIGRRSRRAKAATSKHELLDRRGDRKGRDSKRTSKGTRKRRSRDNDDSDAYSTSSSSSGSEDLSSSDESSSYNSDSDSDYSSGEEERRSGKHSRRRRHKARDERSHRRSHERKDGKVASNGQKQRDSKPLDVAKGNEGEVCFDDDPNIPLALMVRRPGETALQFRARKRASNEFKEKYRLHKARVRAEAKERQRGCQNKENK